MYMKWNGDKFNKGVLEIRWFPYGFFQIGLHRQSVTVIALLTSVARRTDRFEILRSIAFVNDSDRQAMNVSFVMQWVLMKCDIRDENHWFKIDFRSNADRWSVEMTNSDDCSLTYFMVTLVSDEKSSYTHPVDILWHSLVWLRFY